MKAYKCDICGYYCNNVYKIDSDTFDIFPSDKKLYGIKGDGKTEIRDMCECCYKDIRSYIHSKCLKRFQESKNE